MIFEGNDYRLSFDSILLLTKKQSIVFKHNFNIFLVLVSLIDLQQMSGFFFFF